MNFEAFQSCRLYQVILHIGRICDILHGPSMFAVKAKIYDLLYNPAGSIDFDETSSYWSAPKSL